MQAVRAGRIRFSDLLPTKNISRFAPPQKRVVSKKGDLRVVVATGGLLQFTFPDFCSIPQVVYSERTYTVESTDKDLFQSDSLDVVTPYHTLDENDRDRVM